ncbi:WD40-repeat-containing domain protein [Mycena floridula]|nr:WD40-repeat-containing domain protein [Mycena floridula]
MALVESPFLTTSSRPEKQTSISDSYVLSLASLPAHYAASASSPSNAIHIFDKSTLQHVQSLPGHETAITSLKSIEFQAGHALMSSGKDGSIKIWDGRSSSHIIEMNNQRSLLCCDITPDGLTVAAGTELQGDDAVLLYWDPRRPDVPLRTHTATHSDDITVVQFSPTNILLSASTDGLLCTSDPSQDDEDEAGLHVGNWGCSISQAGWTPTSSGPGIWAASDMETFSTWSQELDQLQSLDIRSPSVRNPQQTWVTDYLIACQSTSTSQLGVFVGSNEGDIALMSNSNLSVAGSPWGLHRLWTNGHVGVVRSLLWDEANNILVSGGEDAKINIWPTVRSQDGDSMDIE